MSDEEVEVLLKERDITKIADRDSQEVVGYFETLDLISESFEDISISESSLKICTTFYWNTVRKMNGIKEIASSIAML